MDLLLLVHGIVTGGALVAVTVLIAFRLLVGPLYRRRWGDVPDGFAPTVAVFVPCRGVEGATAENVRRILSLAWPSRKIYFVVESEDDPAWCLLSRAVAGRADARLVVAGRARACAQKLHNLLAAVAARDDAEVLVFIDSDLGVDPDWLHRLLAPLADPRVAATTGGAWVVPVRDSLGEGLHGFWFSLVRFLLSFPLFHGVAGCSTAIRRAEFVSLGVGTAWSTAVSDDMALTRILGAARRRAVYVPTCLAIVHGGAPTVRAAFAWIRRQVQMVKYGARLLWVIAGIGFGAVVVNFLAVPVLAVTAVVLPAALPLLLQAAGACLLSWFGATLLRSGVDDGQPLLPWVLRMPLFIVLAYAGYLSSMFGSTVRWGDAEYRMTFDGRIRGITRRGTACPPGEAGS